MPTRRLVPVGLAVLLALATPAAKAEEPFDLNELTELERQGVSDMLVGFIQGRAGLQKMARTCPQGPDWVKGSRLTVKGAEETFADIKTLSKGRVPRAQFDEVWNGAANASIPCESLTFANFRDQEETYVRVYKMLEGNAQYRKKQGAYMPTTEKDAVAAMQFATQFQFLLSTAGGSGNLGGFGWTLQRYATAVSHQGCKTTFVVDKVKSATNVPSPPTRHVVDWRLVTGVAQKDGMVSVEDKGTPREGVTYFNVVGADNVAILGAFEYLRKACKS